MKLSSYFKQVLIQYKNGIDEIQQILGLTSGRALTKRTVFYELPDEVSTLEKNHLSSILDEIIEGCRNNVFIEFRGGISNEALINVLITNGFKQKKWFNILVNTSKLEEVVSRISDEKLRQINKSLNQGAKIKVAENTEEVYQFYQILKQLYKKKIKKPLPDWLFFKAFFEITNQSGNGIFLLVEFNNRIVGGMMCPIDPRKQLYEWYIAGLDKEMQVKGIYPSVLVTWGALEYACKHNLPRFNFMGAGEPGVPYGVRDFKLRFGGELVNTTRYIKINKPMLYNLGKAVIGLRRYLAGRVGAGKNGRW